MSAFASKTRLLAGVIVAMVGASYAGAQAPEAETPDF